MKYSLYRFLRKVLGIDDRSRLQRSIDNGLKIGKDHNIQEECIIDVSHAFLIEI